MEDSSQTIKLANGHSASDVAIPVPEFPYKSQGMVKSIASTKMAHLTQMYISFIPPESRLDFLPLHFYCSVYTVMRLIIIILMQNIYT